jgi:metal-responsive CopG/Arc/MetJ family transcriptional regulator
MARTVIVKSISFTPGELANLDEMAKAEGRNRSQQINYLIRKSHEPETAMAAPARAKRG